MTVVSLVRTPEKEPEFIANLRAALKRAEAGEFHGVAIILHTKDGEPEIEVTGADNLFLACICEEMGRLAKLQLLQLVSE